MNKKVASFMLGLGLVFFGTASASAYTVQKGDTLSEIAVIHGMTIQDIAKHNPNIKNLNKIYIGEHINTSIDTTKSTKDNNNKIVEVSNTVKGVSEYEQDLLARLVEAEARGESYAGKVAVAEVVLNRVKSDRFPSSVNGVIRQRGQFSPVSNGSINRKASVDSKKAVQEALKGSNKTGGALFFYNHSMLSKTWQQTLNKTAVIGNHTFSKY